MISPTAPGAGVAIDSIIQGWFGPAAPKPQRGLRIAGDPLHLPLLQTMDPTMRPQLAFRTPAQWARRLDAGSVDAVLVSVAGDSHQHPDTFVPPHRNPAVEAIALGRRPLLLLHWPGPGPGPAEDSPGHPENGRQNRWPPQGYLLPPRHHQPGLHQLLAQSGRLPLHCSSAADPGQWLSQLVAQPLLLPADLTLLTIAPWRGAGLVPLRPLSPLVETLWLLLRRGEAHQPPLRKLLQWWGGLGNQLPQSDSPSPQQRHGPRHWRWWWR